MVQDYLDVANWLVDFELRPTDPGWGVWVTELQGRKAPRHNAASRSSC